LSAAALDAPEAPAGLRITDVTFDQFTLRGVTDGLTGLFNHRYFYERLEAEVARNRPHMERLFFKALGQKPAGHRAIHWR